ncbi:MAG: U32 family peptidase [Deltaproteobacteria bacterium]|nr:U32 family peptidase [Deltaproteobacteria bacterium]
MPLRPEILAPAGDRASLEAAVRAGADAVYFGLQSFNARARAENFTEQDLPELMRFLHTNGTKGYVALNTLAFDAELPAVEQAIRACAAAGVDAVIVQDLGVARLCQAVAPALPLHASTQMTCTDAGAVNYAKALGAKRVVLARELSLDDIDAIGKATDVELEVFVHGALCISYSGQCLTSEALGGRSANRGACAQACRLPYELVVDGQLRPLADVAYLLSPQDLEASAVVPKLVEMGVRSFKIEGRLKGPHYVAATTRLYREAIDASVGQGEKPAERTRQVALQTYTRGSDVGFFEGVNHQRLVEGKLCEHRGLQVGHVLGTQKRRQHTYVHTHVTAELRRGDGLLIEGGRVGAGEVGGRVWGLVRKHKDVEAAAAGEDVLVWLGPDVDAASVRAGRRVFRTDDPGAKKAIEAQLAHAHTRAIDIDVVGELGQAFVFTATNSKGVRVVVNGDTPLQVAKQRPLTVAALRDQLGRLGGTPYHLGELRVQMPTDALVPISSLNRARRALVEALTVASEQAWPTTSVTCRSLLEQMPLAVTRTAPAGIYFLCRSLAQARAALAAGADGVYLDFLELTGTGEALRALKGEGAAFVGVAPPRIRKPGEDKIDRFLLGLAPDAVLVRGLGALAELRPQSTGPLFIGDFSLNVANHMSAKTVLSAGLSAFTPSFDLDAKQLQALLDPSLAAHAEVVIHNPMPLFHMEHCVIAALLSKGRDHRTCGRPCETHKVSLRDRAGMEHPVEADVGCRNTVFHAAAQSAAAWAGALKKAGVGRFRVELVREPPAEVASLVQIYRDLLEGRMDATAARHVLKTASGYGVVSGSLRVV